MEDISKWEYFTELFIALHLVTYVIVWAHVVLGKKYFSTKFQRGTIVFIIIVKSCVVTIAVWTSFWKDFSLAWNLDETRFYNFIEYTDLFTLWYGVVVI